MISFKDHRTGGEVLLKAQFMSFDPPDFGLGDLRKRAAGDDLPEALWDSRISSNLRDRIIEFRRQAEQMRDGAAGDARFHKCASEIANEVTNCQDLPPELQVQLVRLVLDGTPAATARHGSAEAKLAKIR